MKENILIFLLILSVSATKRSLNVEKLKANKSSNQIKENMEILNKFFENPEWQNFKDIKNVKYLSRTYSLENIGEVKIKGKKIYINTRAATLFLACTYGNILKKIFLIIDFFIVHCKTSFDDKSNDYGYFCTDILLDTMYNLVPMTTKMNEAMDAIESFHVNPWYNNKTTHYIFSKTFTSLIEIPENYKKSSISQDDPLSNKNMLIYCNQFFLERQSEVELELRIFCSVEDEIMKSTLPNLLIEYENLLINKPKIHMYDFLHNEINNMIKLSIEEKYNKLGFIYDQDTNRTLLPNPNKVRLKSNERFPDRKVVPN